MRRLPLFFMSSMLVACGGSNSVSNPNPTPSMPIAEADLVLEGRVMRGRLPGAEVSIEVSGQTFTTIANEDGEYTLSINVEDADQLLTLNAKGQGVYSHIELVNLLGTVNQLQTNTGEDNTLSYTESDIPNITLLDTSRYLLALDKKAGREFVSSDEWNALVQQVSAEQNLQIAAFLKLLSEEPRSYPLPPNETLLSFAESTSINAAYFNYLRENNLASEYDARLNSDFAEHMLLAKQELVAHEDIYKTLTVNMLQGQFLAEKIVPFLNGLSSGVTNATHWFDFNSEGNTGSSNLNPYPRSSSENNKFSWSLNTTGVDISYFSGLSREPGSLFVSYPFDRVREQWGDEAANFLMANMDVESFSIPTERFDAKDSLTLIHETDTTYTLTSSYTEKSRLLLSELFEWDGEDPVYEVPPFISSVTYLKQIESLWLGKSLDDLTGTWVLPLVYAMDGFSSNNSVVTSEFFAHDKVQIFGEDGEAKGIFAGEFLAQMLTDGSLELRAASGNTRFLVTPYQALSDNEYFASIAYYKGDELMKNQVAKIAQVQVADDDSRFADSLVTDLPIIQSSSIYSPNGIFGDKLAPFRLFGRQFNSDGTMIYAIQGTEDRSQDDLPIFAIRQNTTNTWSSEGSVVTMTRQLNLENPELWTRIWHVISTNEAGQTLVFERALRAADRDEDGTYDEVVVRIPGRINTIEREDLSRWPELWSNTIPLL